MFTRRVTASFAVGVLASCCFGLLLQNTPVLAQSASEIEQLREQIKERNGRLTEIDAEITRLENELQQVGAERSTLQSAINALELERQKVEADIAYTQNQIGATDLELSQLGLEIGDAEETINRNERAIAEILRQLDENDEEPLIVAMLRHSNLSELWNEISELIQVRERMGNQIHELVSQKEILEGKRIDTSQKREELVDLRSQYDYQHQILENNKDEKAVLLTQTRNEEAQYQQLLAEQKAERERFERELQELESKLQFILDPSSIPSAGNAVFAWPLTDVRITQYFGNTAFARTAAYNGSGHNGIDFGVPVGTKVHSALGGEIMAINTQVAPMCQYGKWVLVRHANGLTTLYAHLSVISVNKGDVVGTGDVVGYAGATGYATGPHLHFTVYVSDAVQFTQYTCNSGITLTVPVSAHTGYLNPMDYLPSL